jgi:hypothetical protein
VNALNWPARPPAFAASTRRWQTRRFGGVLDGRWSSAIASRWRPSARTFIRPPSMIFRRAAAPAVGLPRPGRVAARVPSSTTLHVHLMLALAPRGIGRPAFRFQQRLFRRGGSNHRGGDTFRFTSVHAAGARALTCLTHRRTLLAATLTRLIPRTERPPVGGLHVLRERRTDRWHRVTELTRMSAAGRLARSAVPRQEALAAPAGVFAAALHVLTNGRQPGGMLHRFARVETRTAVARWIGRLRAPATPAAVAWSGSHRQVTLAPVTRNHPWVVGWYAAAHHQHVHSTSMHAVHHRQAPVPAPEWREAPPPPAPVMDYARPDTSAASAVAAAVRQLASATARERPAAAAAPPVDIGHLTRQVYQQLEREIRIERERRGW